MSALAALAVAAGWADAVSYLALGHIFIANMTGNTVLLGIAIAQGNSATGLRAGASLAGFCLGVGAGSALVRRRGAVAAFMVEAAALAVVLGVWAATGTLTAAERYALIAVAASAMGIQSAAVILSDTVAATPYITGTLARAIARPAQRPEGGAVWLVYAAGATVGAVAQQAWGVGAGAVPLALVIGVAVRARTSGDPRARSRERLRRHRPRQAPS